MSNKQSRNMGVESLPLHKRSVRNNADVFAVAGSMTPVEEMKLIERLAQEMPDQQDQPVVGLRRFSEIKEFNVEAWLKGAK